MLMGSVKLSRSKMPVDNQLKNGSAEAGEKKPAADSGSWPDNGMTEQDIEMFEMLDIRDRNVPKVSQTATPNNTPLGELKEIYQ